MVRIVLAFLLAAAGLTSTAMGQPPRFATGLRSRLVALCLVLAHTLCASQVAAQGSTSIADRFTRNGPSESLTAPFMSFSTLSTPSALIL